MGESLASFKSVSELDDPLHEYLRICQGDPSLDSTPITAPSDGSLSVQSPSYASTSMLFRKAMEDMILTVSPLVRHTLPYLETEAGRNAPLRRYLPQVLYSSQQLKHESPPRKTKYEEGAAPLSLSSATGERFSFSSTSNEQQLPENLHPFLRTHITPNMSKNQLLALLSDFRARGVRPRINDKPVVSKLSSVTSDEWENIATEQEGRHTDCLDPFNLQRLCVLFSSNCPGALNAPHFCVSPWSSIPSYSSSYYYYYYYYSYYSFDSNYFYLVNQYATLGIIHIF